MLREATGKLSLVGTGPGDPELLTLKALRLVENAQVVFYDRSVAPEILTLSDATAVLICTGSGDAEDPKAHGEALELMRIHARAGHRVVRLLGGDAWMFGPGPAEAAFLHQQGIEVEVVPGVSSPLAAAALAGVPYAAGSQSSFAMVFGQGTGAGWAQAACVPDVLVWQGDEPAARLAERLIRAGRSTFDPVALLPRSCHGEERSVITTLGEIADGMVAWERRGVWVVGQGVRQRTALRHPVGTTATPVE